MPADAPSVSPSKVVVDLQALKRNVLLLRQHVPAHVKICSILKNNAFGHGVGQVASTIAPYVNMLGFVDNYEAHECRRWKVDLPMLRVRPASAEEVADAPHGVHELLASLESAEHYSAAARAANKVVDVHLMINIGENRMSFNLPQDLEGLLAACALPNLNVVGVMAHFPCADKVDVTRQQLATFTAAADMLDVQLTRQLGRPVKLIRHCANTQAAVTLPETHLDMVRVGGGLFGQEANVIPLGLRPAFTWKTEVVLVRKVPAGSAIGYGMAHEFPRDTYVATIPVGYGHGFHKRFGKSKDAWAVHAEVVVRGVRCPVVGRVSSSMANIDLTPLLEATGSLVRIGEEVVLMGLGKDEYNTGEPTDNAPTTEDLAALLNTSFDDMSSAVRATSFRFTPAASHVDRR